MNTLSPSIKEIELSLADTKKQLKTKRAEISKVFKQPIQEMLEKTTERENYNNLTQAKKEYHDKESNDNDNRVKTFAEVRYPEIIENIKKECGDNEELVCYRLSDYYRAKMNKLPTVERKILLHVAEHKNHVGVATLINECKMEGKLISAYLHTLSEKGIVNIHKDTKNNTYALIDSDFQKRIIFASSNTYKHEKKDTPQDKK